MGKDINKTLSSSLHHTRLFSPWSQNNRQQQFGLFEKNEEFEATMMINEDMAKAILQIEGEQLNRIEQNRDEEDIEDNSLSTQAQKLDLYSSSNQQLFLADNLLNSLSKTDQDMEHLFIVPEAQVALVTLENVVAEKRGSFSFHGSSSAPSSLSSSHPQVIQVYTKIGEYLGKYQLGRLPKAFKIIPSLSNWDEILLLTRPQSWSPQAMYEATKIFISNIKATQIKQFFQLVLLHQIRSNLIKNSQQRLDGSLYFSLQQAILKCPALFLKGFLFPLLESGTCTIAEASAIARVIHHTKIPVLHSASALLRLSDVPFTLAIGILLLAFLEKKQALPYRVVDALVIKYFSHQQQTGSQLVLPQIWFHSLYLFVQSYGMDLVPVQKRKLLELVQTIQQHELSQLIEKAIKIQAIDDAENEDDESDDTNNTTYYPSDDSGMAIDDVEEEGFPL